MTPLQRGLLEGLPHYLYTLPYLFLCLFLIVCYSTLTFAVLFVLGCVTQIVNDRNLNRALFICIFPPLLISFFSVIESPSIMRARHHENRNLVEHITADKGKYIFREAFEFSPFREKVDAVLMSKASKEDIDKYSKDILSGNRSFTITSLSKDKEYFFIKTDDGFIFRTPVEMARNLALPVNKTGKTVSDEQRKTNALQKDFEESR